MTDITDIITPLAGEAIVHSPASALEHGHEELGKLLIGLQDAAPSTEGSAGSGGDSRFENQLALVRLGMATSLFFALRTKHAPTAAHCLRVALSCSAWAGRLGLGDADRDRIEVAALLHDLGKIGIPDRILRKPGKLNVDEQLSMDCCAELGCEILRGCTSDVELLDIVRYANTWFDCRRRDPTPRAQQLPLGARMLAIADAFDAMTTDSVYRPALSREHAVKELMQGAGGQFDPELAGDFSRMLEDRPEMLQGAVVDRWLHQLQPQSGEALWSAVAAGSHSNSETVRRETLFHQQLLGTLKDGIVFTDAEGNITQWNDVMEQLSGIPATAIVGQSWDLNGIGLRSKEKKVDDCPVAECLRMSSTCSRQMNIKNSGGEESPVQVQVAPVFGEAQGTYGAVVLVRDLSDQKVLQEKLKSLHRKTILDPLTGIFNRTHFDENLKKLTTQAIKGGPTFSLIMCDIDHFKRVNDVHGHPAGDEALISFAGIMCDHSRDRDLVARYGGEEFLLLAANCDNATAAKRGEAIRNALEKTPLQSLGGEIVTASFGVTEFQPGDSPELIVARADRALLKAKDNGRNRVIQLGSGKQVDLSETTERKRSWFGWFAGNETREENEVDIVTPVPVDLAIEKLRGFIADHSAEIVHVTESQLSLKVNGVCTTGGRRKVDHRIALSVVLTLSEVREDSEYGGENRARKNDTRVHVHINPIRNRDRRNRGLKICIDQLVVSLRSYLMGRVVVFDG